MFCNHGGIATGMAERSYIMSLAGGRKLPSGIAALALLTLWTHRVLAAPPFPPEVAPLRHSNRNRVSAVLVRPQFRDPAIRASSNPVRWDALNLVAASAFDRQRDGVAGMPMRIGVDRAVPGGKLIDTRSAGTWHTMPDGMRVWSLQLEAPGAQAIRVHFKNLALAEGTRLIVTGPPTFTPEVLHGNGRMRAGGFWSTPIVGDVVFLEYQNPTGKAAYPTILIDKVTHIYRKFADENGINGAVAAGTCEQDVMCFNTDTTARDSVARILFTDPDPNSPPGTFLCTGALLVDADPNTFAGYFLTANHCISTDEGAASLVAYWFYQTSSCGGRVPSLGGLPRSTGATLLATSDRILGGTDSTLLRLRNDPSDGQTFASWINTSPPNGSTVMGIHHPGGTFKRYSEEPRRCNRPSAESSPRHGIFTTTGRSDKPNRVPAARHCSTRTGRSSVSCLDSVALPVSFPRATTRINTTTSTAN